MSGKISTYVYSDTGPANNSSVKPSIVIAGNNHMISVRVPCTSEGLIKDLVIKQTAGSSVAFTFELMMSKIPYPVGEYANNTAPVGPVELYRIIDAPPTAVTAGTAFSLANEFDVGYPFRNVDGNHTVNQRFIYLVIIPASGAGANSKWDAIVIFEADVY